MRTSFALLAAAWLLSGTIALAGRAPVISGSYVFTFTETCQAVIATQQNPSPPFDINQVNVVDPGRINHQSGIAVFNPTTGIVTVSGFEASGDLLVLQNLGGSQLTDQSFNVTVSYSNTDTSLSIGTETYHLFFTGAGPARGFTFTGLTEGGCAATGTFYKQ